MKRTREAVEEQAAEDQPRRRKPRPRRPRKPWEVGSPKPPPMVGR